MSTQRQADRQTREHAEAYEKRYRSSRGRTQRQISGQSVADKGRHSQVAIQNNNSSTSKSRALIHGGPKVRRRGYKSQAYHIALRIGSFTVRGQSLHYDISKALVL